MVYHKSCQFVCCSIYLARCMFIASILLVVWCTINLVVCCSIYLASCMLQHQIQLVVCCSIYLTNQLYVVQHLSSQLNRVPLILLVCLLYHLSACQVYVIASILQAVSCIIFRLVVCCSIIYSQLYVVASILLGVCCSIYLACCMLQHHIQRAVCCSIYLASCVLQHLSCQLYVVASILLVI